MKIEEIVEIRVEPLFGKEDEMRYVSDFSCGAETDTLDDYLRGEAFNDIANRVAKVYIAIAYDKDGNDDLLGYYSLKSASIQMVKPTKKEYPFVLLNELAISYQYQGHHFGSLLFESIVIKTRQVQEVIGCCGILVFSINERSRKFYEKMGFESIDIGEEDIVKDAFNVDCLPMVLKV